MKEFIPYELAIELKDLGFDMICLGSYTDKNTFSIGGYYYKTTPSDEKFCIAPLWQQAFEWFRRIYGYHSWVGFYHGVYVGNIIISLDEFHLTIIFGTYEEARLNLLYELIKIVKNNK
jgi:hypothetical protein